MLFILRIHNNWVRSKNPKKIISKWGVTFEIQFRETEIHLFNVVDYFATPKKHNLDY